LKLPLHSFIATQHTAALKTMVQKRLEKYSSRASLEQLTRSSLRLSQLHAFSVVVEYEAVGGGVRSFQMSILTTMNKNEELMYKTLMQLCLLGEHAKIACLLKHSLYHSFKSPSYTVYNQVVT
jgi:hypothetical protein